MRKPGALFTCDKCGKQEFSEMVNGIKPPKPEGWSEITVGGKIYSFCEDCGYVVRKALEYVGIGLND